MRHRRRGHHRSHAALRLRPWHERWIYGAGAVLWLSGAAWLVSHFFLVADGLPAPSEAWWMRAHGLALIVFLVVSGALLPYHVVPGWRQPRNRRSGIFMLTLVAVLTLTGYGLYYSSSEQLRPSISTLHWVIGLAAGVALTVHAILGRRSARAL